MADNALSAMDYVIPPNPAFWKWADDGESISWQSGQTIGFRIELEHVLRRYAVQELPPLSLVLLVLAACRDSWRAAIAVQHNLQSLCGTLHELDSSAQRKLLDGLMAIAELPVELKQPVEAKCTLLEFLFEGQLGMTIPSTTEDARAALLLPRIRSVTGLPSQAGAPPGLRAGLDVMLQGFTRLDAEALRLRRWTGLDQLVQPAQVKVDPVEQIRQLISSLQADHDMGGVARMARALMAVVHLPRQISESDELPMGGVSDITNRGPLDRLLTSELAHDDTTLALRVATNEALYLRREAPPRTPTPRRLILIDAGIRMWGVPRVFATATAMAFVATADSRQGAQIFRVHGDRMEAADLVTRKGLVEHLGILEPDPHPGPALGRLLADPASGHRHDDVVLVTTPDTLADRDFQQHLTRHSSCPLHVATVDRFGAFELSLQHRHGKKVVCSAQLDLDNLLSPRHRPTSALYDTHVSLNLPAIFHTRPFPLRVPKNGFNASTSWVVPQCGVFEMATDGRLLLWDQQGRGPLQICEQVAPRVRIHWADPQCRDGVAIAVIGSGRRSPLRILSVHIASRKAQFCDLALDVGVEHVISGHNGVVFALSPQGVRVLSGRDGRCLQMLTPTELGQAESVEHCCGRFFCSQSSGKWYALAYDGQRAQLETVVSRVMPADQELLTMFDVVGREGPVGITKQGELYFPENDVLKKPANMFCGPLAKVIVSGCGHWLHVYNCFNSSVAGVVDVKRCLFSQSQDNRSIQSLEAAPWVESPKNPLHHRFVSLTANSHSGLVFVSKSGSLWSVQFDQTAKKIWLARQFTARPDPAQRKAFGDRVALGTNRWALRCATWEEGSRAYLDDRGMLHLHSADPSVPEVSLLLAEGEISGWCADGRSWGHPYFLSDSPTATPEEIWEDAIRPFVEQLP